MNAWSLLYDELYMNDMDWVSANGGFEYTPNHLLTVQILSFLETRLISILTLLPKMDFGSMKKI